MTASRAHFQADAGFLLDPLSSIWLLFVTGVGMLIQFIPPDTWRMKAGTTGSSAI